MSTDPTVTLSSGHAMPRVGLGTSKLVEKQIADGIEAGARHLDCARMYGNEAAVGRAVRASKVPRSDFFLTSKLFMTELRETPSARPWPTRCGICRRTILICS